MKERLKQLDAHPSTDISESGGLDLLRRWCSAHKVALAAAAFLNTGCDLLPDEWQLDKSVCVDFAYAPDFASQGDRDVLVIKASFANEAYDDFYTDEFIQESFVWTNDFLVQSSYVDVDRPGIGIGQVDIVGPYQGSENTGSSVSMNEMVEQAYRDGIHVQDYEHIVFFGHREGDSAAQAGLIDVDLEGVCLYKPGMWVMATSDSPAVVGGTITHEILHTWIGHANFSDCDSECATIEYGNPVSLMGGDGGLDLTHKRYLDWIDEKNLLFIDGPGEYEISYRNNAEGTLPVGAVLSRAHLADFNLEWLQPVGLDVGLSDSAYGGLIVTVYDRAKDAEDRLGPTTVRDVEAASLLMDLQPGESGFVLEPGHSFVDEETDMLIRVDEIDGDVLRFTVE